MLFSIGINIINKMDPIEIAIKQALKSPMRKPHGAVLVYRNKVVSRGYNRERSAFITNRHIPGPICGL